MRDGIYNAKIESVSFYREDHGIPTCSIWTKHEGGTQAFGQHDLRHEAYGMAYMLQAFEAVGASSWEKMVGMYCRVDIKDGLIRGIGHIVEDRWFHPSKLVEKWQKAQVEK